MISKKYIGRFQITMQNSALKLKMSSYQDIKSYFIITVEMFQCIQQLFEDFENEKMWEISISISLNP